MIQITISDNEEVEIRATKGLKETKIVTDIVSEALKALQKPKEYKLVLVSYSLKINAVKQVHDALRIGLKEAKDLVDKCEENNEAVLATGSSFEMEKLFNKFDQSCIQVKVVDL